MTNATPAPAYAAQSPELANLREVGGTGFQAGRGRTVFRSNTRPVDGAAYPDGIVVVLDLRRDDEVKRVPHPLRATSGYRRVPLFDPTVELESAEDAVQLDEQYIDWLERHRATIPAAFRALADVDGDALVCCSAGKDRTGVVSALLARLWGADLDRIGTDYALTRELLADQFAAELDASEDRDFTLVQQALTPAVMIKVINHIEECYGSVPNYLRAIGLTDSEIDAL